MSVFIFLASSEDGFIAPVDRSIDWLPEDGGGVDSGFDELLGQCSSVLMGRGTYETVVAAGVWPYTIPVFVATNTELDDPRVRAVSGPVDYLLAALPEGDVYLDGPELITQALSAGLVDIAIVTTIPTNLGQGVALPNPSNGPRQVEYHSQRQLTSGLWQRVYRLVKVPVSA